MKILCAFVIMSTAAFGQDQNPSSLPFNRHYADGQKWTYQMKGVNESWHYQVQADGIVRRDSDGTYFEECRWSHLVSDGQAVALSPASLSFRQRLTLDANHIPEFPNLSQVDTRLIGPITDMITFYSDLWLAAKLKKLTHAGDHFYFQHGTPASWADGNYVLIGQDSIDFDFTVKDVNPSSNSATLVIRHVPPEKPEVKLPAEWMHQQVADTPNNWVQVEKTGAGKYLAAVGKETFDIEIIVSLADGRILSATIDNPVVTLERECSDAGLTQCGDPRPHSIHRQIQISLEP